MRAGYERIGRGVSLGQAKRQCLDKRRFSSRNEARDNAARQANSRPDWDPVFPYRCTICQGWHLSRSRGSQPKPMPSLRKSELRPKNPYAESPRRDKHRPDESENP